MAKNVDASSNGQPEKFSHKVETWPDRLAVFVGQDAMLRGKLKWVQGEFCDPFVSQHNNIQGDWSSMKRAAEEQYT